MPDYRITGVPVPDCTGDYSDAGEHNGKRYYKKVAASWYIWWQLVPARYIISPTLGVPGLIYWEGAWWVDSLYVPQNLAKGDAWCTNYTVWLLMVDYNLDPTATIFHRSWPLNGDEEVIRCSALGTGTNIYIKKTI